MLAILKTNMLENKDEISTAKDSRVCRILMNFGRYYFSNVVLSFFCEIFFISILQHKHYTLNQVLKDGPEGYP